MPIAAAVVWLCSDATAFVVGHALVIHGVETPLIGGVTSGHPILTDPALDGWRPAPLVLAGILREECGRIQVK
jgi:hypothetical protein